MVVVHLEQQVGSQPACVHMFAGTDGDYRFY